MKCPANPLPSTHKEEGVTTTDPIKLSDSVDYSLVVAPRRARPYIRKSRSALAYAIFSLSALLTGSLSRNARASDMDP